MSQNCTETIIDLSEVPDSVEALDAVLQQSQVDINMKDCDGKTLLLKSISMYQSDAFIMHLLKLNSDPNIPDKYNETPLYDAVTRPTITVAHELIKRGGNINAVNKRGCTPLHQAVDYNNLKAVALLLYYGADVNVLSKNNTTPFMNALSYDQVEISEMLINYYSNYDQCLKNNSCPALYFAIQRKSNLACKLVRIGADVNFVTPYRENLLVFSLIYKNSTLFKLMWPQFDYKIILNSEKPFLLTYIQFCKFTSREWVDSLDLILNSCAGVALVQHCNEINLFEELLNSFHRKNINLNDRLRLIYILLSLNVKVTIDDVATVYKYFGFNEELEIFIYFINYDDIKVKCNSELHFFLLPFILGQEDDFDITRQNVCQLQFNNYVSANMKIESYSWLGYFTEPCYASLLSKFPDSWTSKYTELKERLQFLPKCPSLVELSRTQSRKFIRKNYKITKPYHFHDVVKSLNLPQYIKDIIRFKVPVYDYTK